VSQRGDGKGGHHDYAEKKSSKEVLEKETTQPGRGEVGHKDQPEIGYFGQVINRHMQERTQRNWVYDGGESLGEPVEPP